MGLKSAAALPDRTLQEEEMARNNAEAMETILNNLDKNGELTKWLNAYRKKIERYAAGEKPGGARAAKKK